MSTTAPDHGCWAHLWSHQNYRNDRLELRGPGEKPKLSSEKRNDDHSWNDAVDAVTTGERTWIYGYEKSDFGGKRIAIGPMSTISDLNAFNFRDVISSLRIFDHVPADWPGPTAPVKKRRGRVMSDMRRKSVNTTLKDLCGSALGMVPGAGPALETALDVFWPSGKSNRDLLVEGREWVEALLYDVVDKLEGNDYRTTVEGLYEMVYNVVHETDAAKQQRFFDDLFMQVGYLMPKFTDPEQQLAMAQNLTYVVTFGTLALVVYRTGMLESARRHGTPDPLYQDRLRDAIPKLRRAVQTGLDYARQRRLKVPKINQDKNLYGLFGGKYWASDRYTSWEAPRYGYNNENEKKHSKARAESDRDFFHDRCAAPTFDAAFDGYREVADLWSYFDQPDRPTLAQETRTGFMGMWGRPAYQAVRSNEFSSVGSACDVKLAHGERITKIVLHRDSWVVGIEVHVDGKLRAKCGRSTRDSTAVELAADERITAVFGAADDHLYRVMLRVETGKDGSYPVERGAGTEDGGQPFASNGPDGLSAWLTGLSAQADEDGVLRALGCYWTYERILPRPGT